MKPENAIEVLNITKTFKVFLDKGITMKEKILFRNRRRFEERHVLNDVSFTVRRGEAVGLIGHNGCGKSTTLKLLTRIMYPDSGSIEMSGRVSSLIELGAGFHPDMSGRENIYINASIFGLTKKEIDARIEDIIAFSELEEYIENPVRTYSSGMYMRLAFAVAINVDADILLIDEILAVGDANFQSKCFEKLKELKNRGVTIVIVTHDMSAVKRFCDKAIWINDGKIRADGNSLEIVDSYLAYMSDLRIQKEKGREAEESREAGAEAGAETGEDPEKSKDGKRYGNRKAQIIRVDILNEEGKKTNALRFDERFSLQYHFRVNEPVGELNIGMGIFTADGKWIFGTNTLMSNKRVKVSVGESAIRFECEPLKLLTGEYVLQVALVGMDNTPYDYHQEYCRFNVANPYQEAGIIHYDARWID